MPYSKCRHLTAALAALTLAANAVAAQSPSATRPPQALPPPPEAKAVPAKPPMPDVTKLTLLVQTHMAALSHALVTGNFTVLYALGAPDFQKSNSPARLTEMFGQFRTRGIDLLPVVLFQPVLTTDPKLDERGLLRLTGYYNTEPQQVHFDLIFQPVAGAWRLMGISARTAFAKEAAAAPAVGPPMAKLVKTDRTATPVQPK